MIEHIRVTTSPHPCPYLPGETSMMSFRLLREVSAGEFDEMLRRGWRRFGNQFFRPNCPQCARCRSLRIEVEKFTPSKSQRRVLKRCAAVQVVVRAPSVTHEHLKLWNAYHASMSAQKGWETNAKTPEEYATHFIGTGFSFAREFAYYLEGRLVGLGLVDVTATSCSSVYFYHDPALRSLGLGVYSLLKELEYARARAKAHVYLGYWISECASSRYKSDYRPFELLAGFPLDHEEPSWVAEEAWRPILNREEHGLVV